MNIDKSWDVFDYIDRLDTLKSSGVKAPGKLVNLKWIQLSSSVKTKIEKQIGKI